jgi:hypothetical protein
MIGPGLRCLAIVAASLTYRDGQWLQPLNFEGEPCPWPMETLLWAPDAPIGMYHCTHCGDMVLAGVPHGDWRDVDDSEMPPPLPGPVDEIEDVGF